MEENQPHAVHRKYIVGLHIKRLNLNHPHTRKVSTKFFHVLQNGFIYFLQDFLHLFVKQRSFKNVQGMLIFLHTSLLLDRIIHNFKK